MLQAAIGQRLAEVGLTLHPTKTRVVYCKDSNRRGGHPDVSFTFLGYTFRPRHARNKQGTAFTAFLPGMSRDKLVDKGREVRRWRLHRRHQRHAGRPRGSGQPDRAGLDELLGPLLPVPGDPPPDAHQHLPGAMGPQEIQAATRVQTSQGVVEGGCAPQPRTVHALAMDHAVPSDGMVGAV